MIPKSLHTVTVLVHVAKLHIAAHGRQYPKGYMSNRGAAEQAAVTLGYGPNCADAADADTYGLIAKATALLDRARPYGARP